ncbi:MAG: ABC transporter permease [Bryobacteraceae bacterium]
MPEWRSEIEKRLAGLPLRPERESEIVDELAQHLADRYQELRAAGATEADAQRTALEEIGEDKRLAQQLREVEELRLREPVVLGTRERRNMLADLLQDIRYSFRTPAQNPAFTAVAAIALALGIGANTAVFSVFNGVLLNPLPYPEPRALIWLWPADVRTGTPFRGAISPPDFVDYRKQTTVFEHLSAFLQMNLTLTGSGEAERVPAAGVSAGFFETLGIQPALGRAILPEDEQVGWPQIAILSDGLWRRRFGADPRVVGKTLNLDGKGVTIAGVMPPGFDFPKDAQIWQPIPFGYAELKVRRFHFLRVVGRLKPGVTIEQAEAQMKSVCAGLARTYPDSNAVYSSHLVRLLDEMVGDLRPTLTVLMAAVGFVLLIACANVAHLLLARGAARQKEIAIRSSLGASSGRVLRQFLTESLLLAVLGGALGALFAVWELKILVALHAVNVPRLDEVHLNGRVLGFTAALSILSGVLFGLLPALRASRPDLSAILNEQGRGSSAGRAHHRFHNTLVIAEVAIAVVLLSGAVLMIRSFQRLAHVNPGFNPARLMSLQIELPMSPDFDPKRNVSLAFFRPLLERLKALPGVESAGLVSELPLSGQANDTNFTIEGRPPVAPSETPNADQRVVSPGYFQTMGIPLIKGRYFTESDNENSAKVVIVGRTLAEKFFPNQEPVGQHLNIDLGLPFRCEIVGVVGDVLHRSMSGSPYPVTYVPYAQDTQLRANIVIRTRTDALTTAEAIKRQVHALNADVPIFGLHAMDDLVSDSVGWPRFRTLLLGVFAGIALILAAAGIYGVMSYSVTLRTHELGIRVALGAGRKELMKLVVGRGMLLALAGVAVGLAAAAGMARLIANMLYEVPPTDPVSFLTVPLILAAVAFLANYLPARRAMKLDAMTALRHD